MKISEDQVYRSKKWDWERNYLVWITIDPPPGTVVGSLVSGAFSWLS